jgi:hypothetical protein
LRMATAWSCMAPLPSPGGAVRSGVEGAWEVRLLASPVDEGNGAGLLDDTWGPDETSVLVTLEDGFGLIVFMSRLDRQGAEAAGIQAIGFACERSCGAISPAVQRGW